MSLQRWLATAMTLLFAWTLYRRIDANTLDLDLAFWGGLSILWLWSNVNLSERFLSFILHVKAQADELDRLLAGKDKESTRKEQQML